MILFDDKAIQPCKRRTRSWVEINYKLQGAYNDNNNNNNNNNNNEIIITTLNLKRQ